MICGEAAVRSRVPILSCNNQLETLLQAIGQRRDFVTPWDGQL
jgi:hypothetical protein